MTALRKMKAVIILFALVAIMAGGLTIFTTKTVDARPACCIWVMYCSEVPPYACWDVCKPIPCPR